MKKDLTILSTKILHPSVTDDGEKYGIKILSLNFIETNIYVNATLSKTIENANPYLVFTSAKAVEGYLKNSDEKIMMDIQKKIFCLQGETLKAAEIINNSVIKGTAKNAASLAGEIIKDKSVRAVSFICGKSRRDELPDLLKKNNIAVEEIEMYKTCSTGRNVKENYEAVLFFSPSAADSFFQTNILQNNIPCFCIGDTTAGAVNLHTNNQIIISEDSSQQSMLNSVIHHYNLQKKQNL